MNNATHMMIQHEISSYKSSLGNWARQVLAQRRPIEAFRHAAHRPSPASWVSSMKHLANSDKVRAERQIEEHLEKLVADLDIQDPQYPSIMRLSQGHWPRIYRILNDRRLRGAGQEGAGEK
jgi:ABC-type cobalamin transport system ATPase subunit